MSAYFDAIIEGPAYLWDAKHVLLSVQFTGAPAAPDPASVYSGPQVGEGKRSLAFTLRFRAPDRTLTSEEANLARDRAVSRAAERWGARLRG